MPSISFLGPKTKRAQSMGRPPWRSAHLGDLVRPAEQRDAVQDVRVRSYLLVPERAVKVGELSILPSWAKWTGAPFEPVEHTGVAQAETAGDLPLAVGDAPIPQPRLGHHAPLALTWPVVPRVDGAVRERVLGVVIPRAVIP